MTLYRDAELDHWTVNESSLVPTDKALRPPEWIPWKDRLEPTDLAVTDSIGTDPDDPRMEEGFRRTKPVESAESVSDDVQTVEAADGGDNAGADADVVDGSRLWAVPRPRNAGMRDRADRNRCPPKHRMAIHARRADSSFL